MRVRYASGAHAPHPVGGTPAGPPAFLSQKGGGLGEPSPKRARAAARSRSDFTARSRVIALAVMLTAAALLATCTPAHAAGSGMPWEAPLQRILESIEGPVAKVVAVVTIIITGLTLAFGDMGGGFRRLVQIVFGLSIAFAATSFFLSFFSFAGGAMID